MVDLKTQLARAGVAAIFMAVLAGTVSAQTAEQRIADRIRPVGEVCLAGDACASGTAATSQVGTAPSSVAAGQEFDAQQVYVQSCAVCHDSGMAGAPRRDNPEAWSSRVEEKGLATVVQNAITGINAMPARGMCMTCSDEDIEELVMFLLEPQE